MSVFLNYNEYRLITRLKKEEGFSEISYWDNKQYTWGYGTKAPGKNCHISLDTAEIELIKYINLAKNDMARIFGDLVITFSPARTESLIDMRFNLGYSGFRGFKNMIKAIRNDNWLLASYEASDSRWFKEKQVSHKRLMRIIIELASGRSFMI